MFETFHNIPFILLMKGGLNSNMFSLETQEVPSMGLNKYLIDYISTSNKPKSPNEKVSVADRFRNNTSGRTTGGHENVMQLIKKALKQNPVLNNVLMYDADDVYSELTEKLIQSSIDFDPNKANENSMELVAQTQLGYVVSDLMTKAHKQVDRYGQPQTAVSEGDQKGNDNASPTMEAGMSEYLEASSEQEHLFEFTREDAIETLISSLETLVVINENYFVTDKDIKYNSLKLLQHSFAIDRFRQEQNTMENINKKIVQSKVLSTASNKNDYAKSLGMVYRTYYKQNVQKFLADDIATDRTLEGIFHDIIKSFDRLGIDLLWVDADKIVDSEYISYLRSLTHKEKTLTMSGYDFEELDFSLTVNDLKINVIRNIITEEGKVPTQEIPKEFIHIMEKVKQLKISEFRKITSIAHEVTVNFLDKENKNDFIEKRKTKKDVVATLTHTKEYHNRQREAEYGILFGYMRQPSKKKSNLDGPASVKSDQDSLVAGVFSAPSLDIILREIEEHNDHLRETDFFAHENLNRAIDHLMQNSKTPLLVDGNGFIYENVEDLNGGTYRKYYTLEHETFYILKHDNTSFEMNKWLVHSKGYLVNKFTDAFIRSGKDSIRGTNCHKNKLDGLIIKTVRNETIYLGKDDPFASYTNLEKYESKANW